MKIIKLIAGKGQLFHFGVNKLDTTEMVFHSDSLFSAIINNLSIIKGEVSEEDINSFPKISSAFPFNGETLFVPKPIRINKRSNEELDKNSYKINKKLKKIRYIPMSLINKEVKLSNEFIVNHSFLTKEEFIKTITESKSMIPRIRNEENDEKIDRLYNVKSFMFNKDNCGFYFLLDGELSDDLKNAILLIKHQGLGGERSSGKGLFKDVRIEEFNKEFTGDKLMLLSLALPNSDEWVKAERFSLVERKGYAYSYYINGNFLKNPVVMFSEGSIFNEKINGRTVKVISKPVTKHDVYRFGKAFLINIKGELNE